ncbi:MAG: FGGY-family carbohydrate kinase [Spirochaetales bacterium]|nr:FGGY-family carbohydrate kinase [Spirochaetales bacterium]
MDHFVLAYDIGTTGAKTCLYKIGGSLELIASDLCEYPLYILENGGAEQDVEDWWNAMTVTTRAVMKESGIAAEQIEGMSFCSQMQGLVLVDKEGRPLRRAMSYMDQRGGLQQKRGLKRGIKIAGMNVFRLLVSLYLTGGVSASVKDPLWKYKWVEENEPEIFSRVHKWLDVKEALILRCTDRFVMTDDSANATFIYNTRKGRRHWSRTLCRIFGVKYEHMPEMIGATQSAGVLTESAAGSLGLKAGTPVFGGGGDLTLISLGSGMTEENDTHIYMGTSGWVASVLKNRKVDIDSMIASILGARPGYYNYIGEQETSGKCLEWVRDHLALDSIGIYLEKRDIAEDPETVYNTLYEYLSEVISQVPPGSNGVIFTPWLHGNRAPFEDPHARGIFFNINLNTGKRDMIRAVVEGMIFHNRWLLESIGKHVPIGETVRFAGGGAQSDVTCQILADITGKKIEAVADSKNTGAAGAAILCGLGLGIIDGYEKVKEIIPIRKTFCARNEHREIYDKNYSVFKRLYGTNRKSFAILNGGKK